MLRRVGHLDALRLDWEPGASPEPHIFWESDLAKWIEAASYCLEAVDDPTSTPPSTRSSRCWPVLSSRMAT